MTSLRLYKQAKYSSNAVRSILKKDNSFKGRFSLRSNNNNLPIQYQKGYVEFYKLKFKVTPDVLIPRPETELLVDYVLNFVSQLSLFEPEPQSRRPVALPCQQAGCHLSPLVILDLGTGAGNIAISLAKNLPKQLPTRQVGIRIIATDISPKALKVAKQNAKLHGVENSIKFIQSDLLSDLNCNLHLFESERPRSRRPVTCNLIIVTNLPYIPSARIPYLDSSVKDFEPHVALDGGEDGFELYRKLFQQIKEKGWKPNLVIGEIDYTHGELAALEAQKYFPGAGIEVKKDLTHLQRILTIKNFTD